MSLERAASPLAADRRSNGEPVAAADQPAVNETAAFDPEILNELRQIRRPGFPSLAERTIRGFLVDAPRLMSEISDGFATGRHDVVERAAHTLKSSSAYVGLTHVTEIARAIEAMAHTGIGFETIGQNRALLATALDRGRPYLESALATELEPAPTNR